MYRADDVVNTNSNGKTKSWGRDRARLPTVGPEPEEKSASG